ncbi:MAG: hypothetical protein IH994_02745 [Proteobacteria bacterium]|nr:hypothetical protein [Pseudomonadota bacterium]
MAENEVPEKPGDRRGGIDKRQAETEDVDPEHRSGEERRKLPDRRGHHYTFKYSSQENIEELRKWLEANCEGEWTIGIPDREAVEKWGSYRVKFENPGDLAKLAKMLGVYWPNWLK